MPKRGSTSMRKKNARKGKSICLHLQSTKVIYLEWCDAIADVPRWMSVGDAKEWAKNEDWVIRQTCFLLDETKEYILLASRINPHSDTEDDLNVDGLLKLPKTWVRKRIDLSKSISSYRDEPS